MRNATQPCRVLTLQKLSKAIANVASTAAAQWYAAVHTILQSVWPVHYRSGPQPFLRQGPV